MTTWMDHEAAGAEESWGDPFGAVRQAAEEASFGEAGFAGEEASFSEAGFAGEAEEASFSEAGFAGEVEEAYESAFAIEDRYESDETSYPGEFVGETAETYEGPYVGEAGFETYEGPYVGEAGFETYEGEYVGEAGFEACEGPYVGEARFEAYEGPYVGEDHLAAEAASPFVPLPAPSAESWGETGEEASFHHDQAGTPLPCTKDVTFRNKPWPFAKKKCDTADGQATPGRFGANEVLELRLSDFCVDDYRLRPRHREELLKLVAQIADGVRRARYRNEPIRIFVAGETSSTASVKHNLTLSEHRAANTAENLLCLLRREKIDGRVDVKMAAFGEWRSALKTGDRVETPKFRDVEVRVIAPLVPHRCPVRPCPRCEPGRREPSGSSTLCISVPRIEPRQASGFPPNIIPLGSVIPGLALPVAVVSSARATVHLTSGGRNVSYEFRGWGLEISLPTRGSASVDLRAAVRASLEAVARGAGSLAGRLSLGGLGLALRIDASAFAQLVTRLSAELRVHLDVSFGMNVPELTACPPVTATAAGGFDVGALSGPASLIVPGRGLGLAQLRLASPAITSGRLRLSANPISAPADKSTVRALLALGGSLGAPRVSGVREASESDEAGWDRELSEWGEASRFEEAFELGESGETWEAATNLT